MEDPGKSILSVEFSAFYNSYGREKPFMRPTDAQQIDLTQIRQYVANMLQSSSVYVVTCTRDVAPMIRELCDLVENSDLLPNVEQARLDMQAADDREIQGVLDKLNLHSGEVDPEDILPSEY
jgi:hypothetical protein